MKTTPARGTTSCCWRELEVGPAVHTLWVGGQPAFRSLHSANHSISSLFLSPSSLAFLPSLAPTLLPSLHNLLPFIPIFLTLYFSGILQGVSTLLLVFDQAEVRKIVKVCEGIIEYIKVAEVVESMEELVTFTKNLSPGMTSMTKQVDGRTEDLTNPSHADILTAESDQVRELCNSISLSLPAKDPRPFLKLLSSFSVKDPF